jgi:guanylate kinase
VSLLKRGRLIVVSGPSGVGKTTLLKRLLDEEKDRIVFSVSYTSREPRKGESNGVDYFFITEDEFKKDIKNGIFLEYAKVYGHYYGTSKRFVDGIIYTGRDCLLDIDTQGAKSLMKQKIEAFYIFIAPPSIETLRERLVNRALDSAADIKKRFLLAKNELKYQDKYDRVIINDDLNSAYGELKKTIFE